MNFQSATPKKTLALLSFKDSCGVPQPKLVVVAAPSGAGKTTICQRLLLDYKDLVLSISSTTRPPRGTEKNGVEYFFVTPEEFKNEIEKGFFAEYALVHGNYYGTSKKAIELAFQQGNSVLLDIDVQGAASLKKAFQDRCISIFVAPPSLEVLEARLRARATDSEETIQKRIQNARNELLEAPKFDLQVINDDLNRAYEEIKHWLANGCPSDSSRGYENNLKKRVP